MRFNELDSKDLEYIIVTYRSEMSHKEKIDILSSKYNASGRSIRNWWKWLGLKKNLASNIPRELLEARDREIDPSTKIVLVTSAQNKTIINKQMFDNMKVYANYIEQTFGRKVEILIIPTRYRNPTAIRESEKITASEWWDDEVQPNLFYNKILFGDVLISADSRISPTASMPLNGYESLASQNHFIVGHPRLHTRPLPRFKGEISRIMATSGYMTRKNYSISKAGDKGYVHHSYGFVVLEKKKDGTCYPPRTVKVNSEGDFSDYRYYVNKKVSIITKSAGMIWGDIHHNEINGAKYKASMKLQKELNPDNVVFHDLLDASTINPHEFDDLYIQKHKIREGKKNVEKEIDNSLKFVEQFRKQYKGKLSIVQSNHDDFLDRYINKFNWKSDLHNSEAYLKYAMIQQSENIMEYGNIYGFLINERFKGEVKYIKSSSPLIINTYQCGYHGDHGVNGARGNITSFKRLNSKMIFGHGHSPTMIDGCTMVGVSCNLWQYYNSKGLSSWGFADSIIHKSGKNQLIIFDERDMKFTHL